MKKNTKPTKKDKADRSALFIPGGLVLGMGFGFMFNDLVAWLFIGLGAGMVVFAILNFIKK